MTDAPNRWDIVDEWRAVGWLSIGMAVVGLGRWMLGPLVPFMADAGISPACGARGLGLDDQTIGSLVGVLGVVSGVFAIVSGRLADAIGPRKILIPAILWCSLMTGLSGMAMAITSLVFLRALMGRMVSSRGDNQVIRRDNLVLGTLALGLALSCMFVLGVMLPGYLVDHLKLSHAEMAAVASALGFGGFVGQLGVPGLSDLLGRKRTAVASFVGVALAIHALMGIGPDPTRLFIAVFLASLCAFGAVALIVGPIASEAAPVGAISSVIGIMVGAGEILGGGIAPAIGGYLAERAGIAAVLWLPLIGAMLGAVVCACLTETAPNQLAARPVRARVIKPRA
jgi:MFS family permease